MARKPTSPTQRPTDAICSELAEGVSLRSVCAKPGMPSVGTFLRWVGDDPKLAEQYTHARALCMDAMAEQILEIADTPQVGQKSVSKATGLEITEGDMIEHRKLRVESRKWLLAKMAPKKYGDKLETTLKGDPTAPVALTLNGSDVHG